MTLGTTRKGGVPATKVLGSGREICPGFRGERVFAVAALEIPTVGRPDQGRGPVHLRGRSPWQPLAALQLHPHGHRAAGIERRGLRAPLVIRHLGPGRHAGGGDRPVERGDCQGGRRARAQGQVRPAVLHSGPVGPGAVSPADPRGPVEDRQGGQGPTSGSTSSRRARVAARPRAAPPLPCRAGPAAALSIPLRSPACSPSW
jgi:hypothetical protein